MSNRAGAMGATHGGYQTPDPESFIGRGAWATDEPPSDVDLIGLEEAHRRIFDEVQYPDNWPAKNPLHQHMAATFEECLAISKAKNAGYACDADPLANFKTATSLGVSVSTGIAVRMADKWSRLCRLMKTGKNPLPSESITDTLQDLINYAAILLYALDQEEEK